MLNYIYFCGGVALLIKGADFLVSGSSSFARRLGVPEIVIGLTIVAFGTSMPEFLVSVVAGMNGNPEIVIGNVVGSNLCNVLLILGICAMIRPVHAQPNTVFREIPFMVLSSLVVTVQLNDTFLDKGSPAILDRTDGFVLLGYFVVFLYYIALVVRSGGDPILEEEDRPSHTVGFAILFMIAGLAGLVIGGRLTVSGAVGLAESWGMSERFIGLTVVAVGTSLPELATSAVAAFRRNSDIAIGNVVGSNIFNIFFVLGIPALLWPIAYDVSSNIDLIVMNLASIALFATMFIGRPGKTVQRWEGGLFFGSYLAYMAFVLYRG